RLHARLLHHSRRRLLRHYLRTAGAQRSGSSRKKALRPSGRCERDHEYLETKSEQRETATGASRLESQPAHPPAFGEESFFQWARLLGRLQAIRAGNLL